MEIEWEDPPEDALFRQANRGPYLEFALALREREGTWAKVPREYNTESSAQNTAQNMRRGKVKGFVPAGAYEAVSKDLVVWARFIGEPEPEDSAKEKEGPEEDPGNLDPADAGDPKKDFAPKVRAWAKEQGIEIPKHGRLPEGIIKQYLAATGEERPAHLKAVQ